MHFAKQHSVFIHVPKTGGNFFTRCFLRFSDDAMVTSGHQDGADRFELSGDTTKSKHQTLAEYKDLIGPGFADYTVYAFARPPVERMISLYYSPHRWMRKKDGGGFDLDARNEPIDLAEFKALVSSNKSISDLLDAGNISGRLKVNETAQHASGARVSLLDFADLRGGLEKFGRENGFDLTDMPAQKVNSSAVNDPMALNAGQVDRLRQIILESHHGEDQQFFPRKGIKGLIDSLARFFNR
ncbi:sulfotransferase family 2 domain-containing protein [Ruegeria profundi]|uniref:sulfotransferase family 2 domain-containing protein n=1 Tax=Ruegeria profundi TaxID=1685378 RepID=UPI001CD46D48|nr:sulfotransferase family 2 domain-containing protein [Ruegeria profundi]MCA0928934.1 sulfotransferase family protein [Ruegeria profundi]